MADLHMFCPFADGEAWCAGRACACSVACEGGYRCGLAGDAIVDTRPHGTDPFARVPRGGLRGGEDGRDAR